MTAPGAGGMAGVPRGWSRGSAAPGAVQRPSLSLPRCPRRPEK